MVSRTAGTGLATQSPQEMLEKVNGVVSDTNEVAEFRNLLAGPWQDTSFGGLISLINDRNQSIELRERAIWRLRSRKRLLSEEELKSLLQAVTQMAKTDDESPRLTSPTTFTQFTVYRYDPTDLTSPNYPCTVKDILNPAQKMTTPDGDCLEV